MKENEMTSQEHTIAIVEPTLDGESTIDFAKQTVDRGGRATVVVLVGRGTQDAVAAFASSEELTLPDARQIYMERLAQTYAERFSGTEKVTIVADGHHANRIVFATAAQSKATSIVMPQHLVTRRKWKTSVAESQIPVLIAPPRAA